MGPRRANGQLFYGHRKGLWTIYVAQPHPTKRLVTLERNLLAAGAVNVVRLGFELEADLAEESVLPVLDRWRATRPQRRVRLSEEEKLRRGRRLVSAGSPGPGLRAAGQSQG